MDELQLQRVIERNFGDENPEVHLERLGLSVAQRKGKSFPVAASLLTGLQASKAPAAPTPDGSDPTIEQLLAAVPPNTRVPAVHPRAVDVAGWSATELHCNLPALAPAQRRSWPPIPTGSLDPALITRFPRLFPPQFVAGGVSAALAAWRERFSNDKWLLGQVAGIGCRIYGYKDKCQQRVELPNYVDPDDYDFLDAEVAELVRRGAVVDITEAARQQPGLARHVLPITVARSSSGKRRMCWDGRNLNRDVENGKFKMETIKVVAQTMRPNDWFFTLDL